MLISNLMKIWTALDAKVDQSFEAVYLFCLLGIVLTLAFSRLSLI